MNTRLNYIISLSSISTQRSKEYNQFSNIIKSKIKLNLLNKVVASVVRYDREINYENINLLLKTIRNIHSNLNSNSHYVSDSNFNFTYTKKIIVLDLNPYNEIKISIDVNNENIKVIKMNIYSFLSYYNKKNRIIIYEEILKYLKQKDDEIFEKQERKQNQIYNTIDRSKVDKFIYYLKIIIKDIIGDDITLYDLDKNYDLIFVFKNITWRNIKDLLKYNCEIDIYGGNATRRHLLNTVQANLTYFLLLINNLQLDKKIIYNSYNYVGKEEESRNMYMREININEKKWRIEEYNKKIRYIVDDNYEIIFLTNLVEEGTSVINVEDFNIKMSSLYNILHRIKETNNKMYEYNEILKKIEEEIVKRSSWSVNGNSNMAEKKLKSIESRLKAYGIEKQNIEADISKLDDQIEHSIFKFYLMVPDFFYDDGICKLDERLCVNFEKKKEKLESIIKEINKEKNSSNLKEKYKLLITYYRDNDSSNINNKINNNISVNKDKNNTNENSNSNNDIIIDDNTTNYTFERNDNNKITKTESSLLNEKLNKNNNISNYPYSQKREYHSSSNLKMDGTDNETNIIELTSKKENKFIYISYLDEVKNIIEKYKFNLKLAQREIEENWLDIMKKNIENDNYILTSKKHNLMSIIKSAVVTLNTEYENKLLKRRFPTLHEELNNVDMLIITLSIVLTYHNKIRDTHLFTLIGEQILYEIYKNKLKKHKKLIEKNISVPVQLDNTKNDSSFSNISLTFLSLLDFINKEIKTNKDIKIKIGYFFFFIFCQYQHALFIPKELSSVSNNNVLISSQYNEIDKIVDKEEEEEDDVKKIDNLFNLEDTKSNYVINSEYLDEIREKIMIHPSTLPMLCPPNKWSDNEYGGYLTNTIRKKPIITGSTLHDHAIEGRTNLFKAINYLNSIEFSINTKLLSYLENEGRYLLDINKPDEKIDKYQRKIMLKIANIFSNIPFYLSVHADWRSRIYTQSFFISYQGGDLSTSLLNFKEGKSLNEEGKYYFYIYGANNHNEAEVGKESFYKRNKWVEDNYNRIINLDRDLIMEAENKFIFTAFCLNMRELHNDPNYKISTPIFLDATCSGIQHLAALMKDLELGLHVNLSPYKEDEKPGDIYTKLVQPINNEINKRGEKDPENYHNLALIKLNRKILKQSIMTKVYNVTNYGIAEQLKSKMLSTQKIDDKEQNYVSLNNVNNQLISNLKKNKDNNIFLAPGKYDKKVQITVKDIYKIAEVINEQIFVIFPSLNNIYTYFIEISELMIKLDIPLTWITPNGIKFTQRYLKTQQRKIAFTLFGKTKKLVLKEKNNKINNRKQVHAIIPNIIHSLDATHLINVINISKENNFYPVITVHDCFGTLPSLMPNLDYTVKKEFILLYSQNNFLKKFHKRIIQSIKDNGFTITKKNKTNQVKLKNNKFLIIPNVPKLGELDLQKIKDSKYMIS